MCIGKTADLLRLSPDLIDPAGMRPERKPDDWEMTRLKHRVFSHLQRRLVKSPVNVLISLQSASFSKLVSAGMKLSLTPEVCL